MDTTKYDDMLVEILKDKKTIIGFLETIFGFLSRRTDFYYESKTFNEPVGFPPGMKERIVLKVIQDFDPRHKKSQRQVPKVAKEEVVETTEEIPSDLEPVSEPPIQVPAPTPPKPATMHKTPPKFQSNEYYNGGCYGTYCWSQSATEIELHVLLPEHISTSKQLLIKIDAEHILISERSNPDSIILSGKLPHKCKNNDAVWSVSNRKLQITLDKSKEVWWELFLEDEPRLDLGKIDCSRSLEELPEESQAIIEKLQWDQRQKALGLPTSDDIKNRDILKKAWNAEGSPFKGQPFDPSLVNFN